MNGDTITVRKHVHTLGLAFTMFTPKAWIFTTLAASIGLVVRQQQLNKEGVVKNSAWLLLLLIIPHAQAQEHRTLYAGQQGREIKALSPSEVQAYLTGQGVGLAKAAELNRYPGPLHVLELAEQLRLTESQKAQTEKIRVKMLAEAIRLGNFIVERERDLDDLFARNKIESGRLRSLVEEIARLQGELRFVHLQAHLESRRVLTADQIRRYSELRGYEGKDGAAQHEGHQQRKD